MGSLANSLKKLGRSIKTLSLDRDITLKWSESVKLVIQNFPEEEDLDEMKEESSSDLGALEEELILLKAAYALSNVNRRLSLSKLLDLQGNVRVICRVRPYLSCETQPEDEAGPLEILPPAELRVACHGEAAKSYKFDRVFSPTASQDEIFWEVQPAIKSAMDGYNVCVLAYGQTGSGKTHTMEGYKSSPGIVPRSLYQLFNIKEVQSNVQSVRLTLSMLEIYKGALRDLLVARPTRIADPPPKSLNIHLSASEHVEVENLTEYVIESAVDALKLYRKGLRARATCSTSSNETSSRSHCLVRLNISRTVAGSEQGKAPRTSVSKLWFIDLGGSERFFKTQVWGKPLEEGKAINVSLTALGDVISALQKKQAHIPYRNSKLTQILKDCLGGTAKVVLFAHASPREEDQGETLCTLNFASRARGIHLNRDIPGMVRERDSRISTIVDKMQALEGECQRLSVDIQALETTIKKKRSEVDHKNSHQRLLDSQSAESRALEAAKSLNSVPRFMNPTISSLCKNRFTVPEFEPVWPEMTMKKPVRQAQLHSQQLLGNSYSFNATRPGRLLMSVEHSNSPQVSVDLGGKRGGRLVTPPSQIHEAGSPKSSSGKKNIAKVQRRLTLECSSKIIRVEQQFKTKLCSA